MSGAALDRLLAFLVAALLVTGLVSLRAGTPSTAPLFVIHGLLGGSLLAAIFVKLRRSVPRAAGGRRWGPLCLALLLALLASAALAGGFLWVASGRILVVGPWTVLTLHVWAALALVPILAWHLMPRRWRLLRLPSRGRSERISRRTALGFLGFASVGLAAWVAANVIERATGGLRRFTGSRWLPDGGVPPPTTFFGEGAPPLDAAAWRLTVDGAVRRPLQLTMGDLASMGQVDREAVLDCTSGWALRTTWHGVPLGAVVSRSQPDDDAGTVTVHSATGWFARLPMEEARRAMLATGVAGQPLPLGNGAPCRLVAEDRRGLEWVKWVTRIEVS